MDAILKFQGLLEKLFQFDASDLDFGIYRILNFKRDQIRKFIQKDLKDTVEKVFAIHKDERLDNIGLQLEDAKQKVIQTLGPGAISTTGELKEEFKGTPVGRDYRAIKAQKEEAETIDEIKLQVFNDLYNFFARYYEEGDFVPQYRYSIKNHKYAIPYNGEEVKLYWANCDQYYTKTGILFRDYAFFTDAGKTFKIIFRTVTAKEELGSNKATKARFFVLDGDTPCEMKDGKTLIIRFQYRELNGGEVTKYGVEGGSNTSRQEKINGKIHEAVINKMKDATLKAFLGGPYKNDKPLLLYQLGRFSVKNTKDYFIHKNLKRFLSEQLDYFIKAEVISLETLEKERFFDKHITRAKVVREIGEKIIDFLSQIEDFQKKLWEKKKFVLKTEYVITTDLVPEELYPEILKNKAQANEWKELGFEVAKSKPKLKDMKLPIDTKHFPEEFKEKLLERITESADLDDLLDGLLIKSENWQALSLLQEKYRQQVKCIHIDPPYNTQTSGFLYMNFYQHSSWLAMIHDRLGKSVELLKRPGVLACHIDEYEMEHLHMLLEQTPTENAGTLVWDKGMPTTGAHGIATQHEYVLFRTKGNPDIRTAKKNIAVIHAKTRELLAQFGAPTKEAISEYRQWLRSQTDFSKSELTYDQFDKTGRAFRSDNMSATDRRTHDKFYIPLVHPSTGKPCPVPEYGWRYTPESMSKLLAEGLILFGEDHLSMPRKKTYLERTTSNQMPSIFRSGSRGKVLLDNLGLEFPFAHAVDFYAHIIDASSESDDLILDYFAGSGTTAHAVININRQDGGNRKYILVEMANYFDNVLLPRIKKVVFSDDWKDGKPQNSNGISHFIKYQYLEQYEDALDNLELALDKTALKLFGDEYLLKYFLDFETQNNPSLLNIEHLKTPFSYKLKVNLEEVGEPQEVIVDIPETFDYLLGLKVNKVKVRRHKGRKYLFTLGEKESRTIAVVWREYDDKWTQADFKKDKDFIIEELGSWSPQIVYVNGQSVLTPTFGDHVVEIRSIEPEFKRLMEG